MIIRNTSSVLIALLFIGLTQSREWKLHDPKCRMPNGYAGECRHLEECQPLFELNEKLQKTELDILYLQQSSCGTTSSFRYKVCCPPPSEWSRVLEVNPVMFPELIDYNSDRGPTWGNRNTVSKPTVTDRGTPFNSQFPTAWNVYGFNNGNSQRVGQNTNGQIAPNANNYGFGNSYSHKFGQYPTIGQASWSNANAQGNYNDHTQKVAQSPFISQATWNANSDGFATYRPQKDCDTPSIGQATWSISNTRQPDKEHTNKVVQTTFNGQTTWNPNSDRFNNNQPQGVGGTPTMSHTQNENTHGPNDGVAQGIGQNLFIDLTSLWDVNNFFSNNQRPSVDQTSSNNKPSHEVEIISSNEETTTSTNAPELNTDRAQTNDEAAAGEQTTMNANGLENDQRIGESASETNAYEVDKKQNAKDTPPSDVPIPLSSIGQGLDNDVKIGDDGEIFFNINTDRLDPDQREKQTEANTQASATAPTQESDVITTTAKNSDRCGVQSAVLNSAVVGADTAPEQYPWLALLEYAGGVVTCGGSLISRQHVLTAAHCVETMRGKPTAVRLSEYNMSTYPVDVVMKTDGNSEVINVTVVPIEWSRMHPLFSHSLYQHDIGLVKMTQEIQYSDFIRPICLPQADYTKRFDVGTNLLVAGWGTDRWDVAEVKTDNRVPFVPIDICHRLVKRAIGNKQLCAGERPTRKQCLGDYGGPLMFETDEFYVAVGVISYGPQQCGDGAAPDVYTNVYEYMDWIKDNMADSDDDTTTTKGTNL